MVQDNGCYWHPLESGGKKILFLTKEEGEFYLQRWQIRNNYNKGFVKAICD